MMKEIRYIHSEAYAAGELKHGTIRGAYLMGLTASGNYALEDTVNFAVDIPKTNGHFAASLAVIPLQLLGYYLGVAKGLPVISISLKSVDGLTFETASALRRRNRRAKMKYKHWRDANFAVSRCRICLRERCVHR